MAVILEHKGVGRMWRCLRDAGGRAGGALAVGVLACSAMHNVHGRAQIRLILTPVTEHIPNTCCV